MELTVDSPKVKLMEDVRDRVADLATHVAVMAAGQKNLSESVNRIELLVEAQAAISDDYRAQLREDIDVIRETIRTNNHEVDLMKRDIEQLQKRGLVNLIRVNAPVITIVLAILTVLTAVGRWLMANLK